MLLYVALTSLVLLVVAVPTSRWFKRRAAFRQFAERSGWRFVGVLPSDKRAPYIHFEHVRSAVMLYHVMEGRAEELEMTVFDYPASKRSTWTAAILTLPKDVAPLRIDPASTFHSARATLGAALGGWGRVTPSHPSLAARTVITAADSESVDGTLGPRASALLASREHYTVETHFSYLRVTPRRQIAPQELDEFVGFCTQLARALMGDAR